MEDCEDDCLHLCCCCCFEDRLSQNEDDEELELSVKKPRGRTLIMEKEEIFAMQSVLINIMISKERCFSYISSMKWESYALETKENVDILLHIAYPEIQANQYMNCRLSQLKSFYVIPDLKIPVENIDSIAMKEIFMECVQLNHGKWVQITFLEEGMTLEYPRKDNAVSMNMSVSMLGELEACVEIEEASPGILDSTSDMEFDKVFLVKRVGGNGSVKFVVMMYCLKQIGRDVAVWMEAVLLDESAHYDMMIKMALLQGVKTLAEESKKADEVWRKKCKELEQRKAMENDKKNTILNN